MSRTALHALVLFSCVVLSNCDESSDSDRSSDHNNPNRLPASQSTQQGDLTQTQNPNIPQSNNAEDFGTYRRELVNFQGHIGDNVEGFLYLPSKQISQPIPGLMLQYGIGGDKNNSTIAAVAAQFANRGFAILTIDVQGAGSRTGAKNTGDKISDFLTKVTPAAFDRYFGDYQKALTYFAARPEVDGNRVGYGGASWGAITGTSFVARDKRIKAFVSIVGGGGFFGLMPQQFDPANTIGQIAPRPVYLLNAKNDEVIFSIFSQALHNAAPSAQKKWLDTNHTLDGVDKNQLGEDLISFFSRTL